MKSLYRNVLNILVVSLLASGSLMAQLSATTPETLVNATTSLSQQNAAVAMDTNGRYVVVWESENEDGDGFGIYAKIYNADHSVRVSDFQVNSNTTRDQRFPDVAISPDGSSIGVVWQSNHTSANLWSSHIRVFDINGAFATGESEISSSSAFSQMHPAITSGDGEFAVTYMSNESSGDLYDIYGRMYMHSGAALTSDFVVHSDAGSQLSHPDVAMDTAGNSVYVWQDYAFIGNVTNIRARLYDNSGTATSSDFNVTVETSKNHVNPSVAMDADGRFIVLYSEYNGDGDHYGIRGRKFSATGVTQGSEFTVNNDTAGSQDHANIAISREGNTYVATWTDDQNEGDGPGVYYRVFDWNLNYTSTAQIVNETTADYQLLSDVAIGKDTSNVVFVWQGGLRMDNSLSSLDPSYYGVYTKAIGDTTPPTAICQNITVYLDATGSATISATDVDGGSYDNTGLPLTYAVSQSTFNCSEVGNVNITLTVTDAVGLTDNCTSTVQVLDTVSPTVVCQNVTVYLDGSGNASITAADIDGGSSDACGISTYVASQTSFTCADVGANNVTLTVTDVNGNSNACNATVTVVDSVTPTAVCQDITVYLDGSGNASITGADLDGGSTDNCSLSSFSASQTSFTCANVGANSVTLTVTDAGGNTSACTATVTVVDSTAPTASCQDITVYLDGAGTASITAGDVDAGSTDNCNIASTMIDVSSFNCFNVGANTVTLTVTDDYANSNTCTSTVTVIDSTAPVISCQDVTVYLDGTGNATINPTDLNGGASDNCAIASVTASQTSFGCSSVGVNNVTVTVTDASGNSSACTANVTVLDTISPTAVCQDITVYLDGSGNASITASDLDGGSTDNCGAPTLSISTSSFTCAETGANSVVLTATDASGNTSTCTATVTVLDTISPTAVCQDITVYLDGAGSATITAGDIDGGSTDNCSIVTTTADITSFTCANVGANTVTLTVTDASGNSSSCTATVTVLDTISPTAVCQDITVYLDGSGSATITAGDIDGGSSDNCSIVTTTADITSFTCANVGANTVTLTVTDPSGNSSSCAATVTVLDTISPTAVCQDITVYLDGSGNASITASDLDGGSTDNCGAPTLSISASSFTCAETGANSVVLTATDASGNTSTCTATVTVLDTISPTAVCQDITVYLDGAGSATITAGDIDGGSTDNCSIVTTTADVTSFNCVDVGANTVTLTVTDASGNSSSCTATVTVLDTISPTAVCQDITVYLDGSGSATITAGDIDGGSSDNCSIVTTTADITSFTCANVGANTVTLTVTDPSGNSSSCAATVTVLDTISPTAVCQDITVYLDGSGNASITASDLDGGSTDNCGAPTLSISASSFTCVETGANSVVLTATDASGNTSTCTATVTVLDTISPTAVCQDITVYLDGAGAATIAGADIDGGSTDNCSIATTIADITSFTCADLGANTVTLTVTDASGNSSSCTATVTVEDTISPTAICQDVTVYLDGAGLASINPGDLDAGSFDNCFSVTFASSDSSFTCADLGANTITLTVTGAVGSTATCTSIVTVVDTIAPVIIGCPGDTTISANSAGCEATYTWTEPSTTDNCSATLTSTHNSGDAFPLGITTVTYTSTDPEGNTATCSFNVTVISDLAVTVSGTDALCNGDSTGTATAVGSGGVSPYSYSWSTGEVGDVEGSLAAGTHTVTVTDDIGCTASADVVIDEPTALSLSATTQDELSGMDGSIDLTVTGGTPAYTYEWSNSEVTEDLTGLEGNMTYTVIVTDDNGCMDTLDVYVDSKVGLDDIVDVDGYEMVIFPNPTNNGNFSVEFTGDWSGEIKVEMYDARGRLVYETTTIDMLLKVHAGELQQGTYYLRATDAEKVTLMRRVIKFKDE